MIAAHTHEPEKRREPLAGGSSAHYGNNGNEIVAQCLAHPQDEPPEHNDKRQRFIYWALMVGAVPPERLTERVLEEVRYEAGAQ